MLISINTEKTFEKYPTHFQIKTLNNQGIAGNFFSLIKDILKTPPDNITPSL
jgi:hypothetical protein